MEYGHTAYSTDGTLEWIPEGDTEHERDTAGRVIWGDAIEGVQRILSHDLPRGVLDYVFPAKVA